MYQTDCVLNVYYKGYCTIQGQYGKVTPINGECAAKVEWEVQSSSYHNHDKSYDIPML